MSSTRTMFRSPSPAPSIAPSVLSQAPSSWLDIDPLAQSSGMASTTDLSDRRLPGRRSTSLAPGGHDSTRRSASSDHRSRRPDPAMGIFNSAYGWSGDADRVSGAEDDESVSKGSKWSRGSVFSRVFKTNDSTSLVPPLPDKTHGVIHARSESTDLLQPKDMLGDASSSSHGHRAGPVDRSNTPPARPSTATHLSKSPTSKKKHDKRRRPMSLNLPDKVDAAPPPTINTLAPETRSDLLRKNRKLQQMLGNDYYANPNGPNAHRTTKSEDNHPINGLAASLGKKSGKAFSKAPLGYEAIGRSGTRAASESAPSSQPISSSHRLLSQGSAYEDSNRPMKRSQSSQLVKLSTPPSSMSNPSRPTHLGPRSRSFSASSSHLSPIPSTPDSFMDFSSDAGELFLVTPTSAKIPRRHPFATPLPNDAFSIRSASLSVSSAGRGDTKSTPRPLKAKDEDDVSSTSPVVSRYSGALPSPEYATDRRRISMSPPSTPLLGAIQPHPYAVRGRSHSVSSISTIETTLVLDPDSQERKRRRDQLAKLHRYLGSNVPAGVILGSPTPDDLPAPAPADDADNESDEEGKWWKGKKRSTVGSSDWTREDDDNGIPMTEHDRTVNVRRKAKMEKMFGQNPPQGLYISRSGGDAGVDLDEPSKPTIKVVTQPMSPNGPTSPIFAGINSLEYLRHSHSLNSLGYLIDKEDTESLRNLFNEIVKEDPLTEMEEEIVFAPPEDLDDDEDELVDMGVIKRPFLHPSRDPRRRSIPHSLGSRRRSSAVTASSPLAGSSSSPTALTHNKRNSASSFASLDLMIEPDAFQQRRKRAAKLTKFFGTDYRFLFGEVLESIENGVRDDRERGSLTDTEARDLLRTLEKLRAKREVILPLNLAIY